MRILIRSAYFTLLTLICVSCASKIKRLEISENANPSEEIAKLEKAVTDGLTDQADLLANSEFSNAKKYLEKAKADLKNNLKPTVTLENVAYGQAFIQVAVNKAKTNRYAYENLILARQAARQAGANTLPDLASRMIAVDECSQYHTDHFTTLIKQEKMTELENRYHELELLAIQHNKLAPVRELLKTAKDENADRVAPQSYRAAKNALKDAEIKISEGRYEELAYQPLIEAAKKNAENLVRIMNMIKTSGADAKLNESLALQSLQQKRMIASPPEENNSK